jgi:cell division protein FtsI/penicillin-binding protein 2
MTRRAGRASPGARTGVSRARLIVLCLAWILAFGLLLARMVDLQVVRGARLQRLALLQQTESVRFPSHRGLIVDRMGRPLAENIEAQSVYAVPQAILDPATFARRIGPVLGLAPPDVRARLRRGGSQFAWLARRLPARALQALREMEFGEAIGIVPESRRAYPAGSLAASVIGFSGIDGVGLAGLELQYDALLRGVGGVGTADRDGIGRELIHTERIVTRPRDGDTLVLTLDEVIQHIAERELGRALDQTRARGGVAIVMDPWTGDLLALASLPSFDPNHYETAPPALWKNSAVAEVYEPGSTFKVILAAAALSSRVVTQKETFPDAGRIRINGFVIHDAEPVGHTPALTLSEIVIHSSNVGASQVATRLGRTAFDAYIHQFGFGQPTGVDLPGEVEGIVRPASRWQGPSLQTIAFGQGISVTPIQLLVAVSALATHGVAVRPHVAGVVRDPDGHAVATPGDLPPHRVIEADVADRVLAMMRGVVQEGTGTRAQIDGYTVAGKTGTAQRPSPSGGYDPHAYVASFVGVVPATTPRLAILVVVDGPHGAYFGGDVAAPVFREIARQALWYLHVPPTQVPPADTSSPSSAQAAPAPSGGPGEASTNAGTRP